MISIFSSSLLLVMSANGAGILPADADADGSAIVVTATRSPTPIDELPQIFNVLKGELSLVGPRPHAVLAQTQNRTYSDVVEGYFARHRVKPGVTGWAQINGWRGEIDHDDKIKKRTEYDLHYIENWSLLLDLRIILRTLLVGFSHPNAY